jgi:hypothetical protein
MAKWIGRRAWRCIHCGWRGILKSDQGSIFRQIMGTAKLKPIQVIIVIIVTLLAVAAILYWLIQEPEKPETPVQTGYHHNSGDRFEICPPAHALSRFFHADV